MAGRTLAAVEAGTLRLEVGQGRRCWTRVEPGRGTGTVACIGQARCVPAPGRLSAPNHCMYPFLKVNSHEPHSDPLSRRSLAATETAQ